MHRFMTSTVLVAAFCLLIAASSFTATAQITFTSYQVTTNAIDDGSVHFSEPVRVLTTTDVEAAAPATFALSQNYPNPFNPATQIAFQTAQAGPVELVVFDQLGREVATLVNGDMPAGRHAVSFQAAGHASGVYFARLRAGEQTSMIRMMLMK